MFSTKKWWLDVDYTRNLYVETLLVFIENSMGILKNEMKNWKCIFFGHKDPALENAQRDEASFEIWKTMERNCERCGKNLKPTKK